MNPQNTKYDQTLAAFFGASMENVLRQPLTAVSVTMINNNQSMASACKSLYKEGGIKRFYNGYQGYFISWIMRSSHRITTFGLNHHLNSNNTSSFAIAVATTAAEFATTAFGELILTVAQNQNIKATPIKLIKSRYQKEGLKSLTTGFIGNNVRNIIFNGILFGSKNKYEKEIKSHPFLGSLAISLAAVTFSHPFEVIRVQKVKDHKRSYLQTTYEIFSKSSYKGFMQGLIPRLYSAGVGTFVMMFVSTHILNKKNNSG